MMSVRVGTTHCGALKAKSYSLSIMWSATLCISGHLIELLNIYECFCHIAANDLFIRDQFSFEITIFFARLSSYTIPTTSTCFKWFSQEAYWKQEYPTSLRYEAVHNDRVERVSTCSTIVIEACNVARFWLALIFVHDCYIYEFPYLRPSSHWKELQFWHNPCFLQFEPSLATYRSTSL